MYGIDSYSSNPVSTFVKFRKLASIYGIDLNIIPSPIRTRDFQNGLYDQALKAMWSQLHPLLATRNVPPIDANAHEIRMFLNDDTNRALLMNIRRLNLSGLKLEVVPPELDRLNNLQELNLSNNYLTQVPNFNLPLLTKLELNNNHLTQVPNFNLPLLTGLALYNNQLTQVPNFNLPRLTKLALHNNQLTQVPNFTNLPLLTQLALGKNQLTQVPNFNNLPLLTGLGLYNNQLTQVPNFNLPLLTGLGLHNNQLTQVPNFNKLPLLAQLKLSGNILMDIPNAVLNKFNNSDFAQLFHSQLTYKCQSSLALLYQTLIANKPLQEQKNAFEALDQKDQNLISEIGYEFALNNPIDSQDLHERRLPYFNIAVQKAILTKFNQLPDNKKNQVYQEIYHLAGKPQTDDPQWGEHHAMEHPPRLADAIARVSLSSPTSKPSKFNTETL
jgi:hypothetical protein